MEQGSGAKSISRTDINNEENLEIKSCGLKIINENTVSFELDSKLSRYPDSI